MVLTKSSIRGAISIEPELEEECFDWSVVLTESFLGLDGVILSDIYHVEDTSEDMEFPGISLQVMEAQAPCSCSTEVFTTSFSYLYS